MTSTTTVHAGGPATTPSGVTLAPIDIAVPGTTRLEDLRLEPAGSGRWVVGTEQHQFRRHQPELVAGPEFGPGFRNDTVALDAYQQHLYDTKVPAGERRGVVLVTDVAGTRLHPLEVREQGSTAIQPWKPSGAQGYRLGHQQLSIREVESLYDGVEILQRADSPATSPARAAVQALQRNARTIGITAAVAGVLALGGVGLSQVDWSSGGGDRGGVSSAPEYPEYPDYPSTSSGPSYGGGYDSGNSSGSYDGGTSPGDDW